MESSFQSELIKEIEDLFPECIVIKNDPNYIQGFPDLLILFENNWAALEVKNSKFSNLQQNQKYYIDLLDNMSYASIIYPENKERVFHELQKAFRNKRSTTRISIRK